MRPSHQNTVTRQTDYIEPMESRTLLAAHFGLNAALVGLAQANPRLAVHAAPVNEFAALPRSISPMSAQPFADSGVASSIQPRLIVADGEVAVLFPQPGFGAVAISVTSGQMTYFNSVANHQAALPAQGDPSTWQPGEYNEARAYRGYRGPAPRSTNNSRPTPRDVNDNDSSSDAVARPVTYDVSSGASTASTTVNAASAATRAVARSIFSTEAVNAQTTTTPVRATAALTAASAPMVFQSLWGARSVMVYASVLPQELAPALAEAHGAAVAVHVMADAPAAADLAVSAAVHALPAPRHILQFARIGSPFMLLADSVGEFIQESAAMTGIVAQPQSGQHQRAWTVTFTVIAADVAMLTYYFHTRRKARLAQALQPLVA